MNFKKITALICAFAFMSLNLINVSAEGYRVACIGGKTAGKTQLLNRTAGWSFDDQYVATIEAMYTVLNVDTGRLGTWDIPGQEKSRFLVPMYLRDANVVVIVVDITNPRGVDGVNVWNNLANQHCPDATKVLVVNKTDLENQVGTVPRNAIAEKAAKLGIKHIFYVSAKTGEGIEDFKSGLTAIAHEINASSVVAEPRIEATAAAEGEEGTSLATKLLLGTVGFGAIGFTAWWSFKDWFCGNQMQNLPGGDEIISQNYNDLT
jgi:small GTP-binding protein